MSRKRRPASQYFKCELEDPDNIIYKTYSTCALFVVRKNITYILRRYNRDGTVDVFTTRNKMGKGNLCDWTTRPYKKTYLTEDEVLLELL